MRACKLGATHFSSPSHEPPNWRQQSNKKLLALPKQHVPILCTCKYTVCNQDTSQSLSAHLSDECERGMYETVSDLLIASPADKSPDTSLTNALTPIPTALGLPEEPLVNSNENNRSGFPSNALGVEPSAFGYTPPAASNGDGSSTTSKSLEHTQSKKENVEWDPAYDTGTCPSITTTDLSDAQSRACAFQSPDSLGVSRFCITHRVLQLACVQRLRKAWLGIS